MKKIEVLLNVSSSTEFGNGGGHTTNFLLASDNVFEAKGIDKTVSFASLGIGRSEEQEKIPMGFYKITIEKIKA